MKLQIIPARTGVQWVKLGVQTFWRQPMALAALFFLAMAGMSLVSLVPFIGPALALALLPSTSLAMMVAAAEATQGRFPTPTLLLVAFRTGRQRLRAMVTLGLLYAVGFLGIMALSALIDGGAFANVYLGGAPMTIATAEDPQFQTAMWFSMALYIPLSLLFWHAPGLIHWHGIAPVKALFFSFVACLRNWQAYLVFSIAWMVFFLGCGMVLALVTGILISMIGAVASGIMVGAAMILAAMFFTSIVFTFRDSFSAPDAADALTASPQPGHDTA